MAAILTILAQAGPYWYHDHMNGGDWWPMALVMALFMAVVVVLLVWLVRGGGVARGDSPEDILKRRLAEGSISEDEYKSRLAALKKSD